MKWKKTSQEYLISDKNLSPKPLLRSPRAVPDKAQDSKKEGSRSMRSQFKVKLSKNSFKGEISKTSNPLWSNMRQLN
jgi:hypothetical protein